MQPIETRKGPSDLTAFELKDKILSSVVHSPDAAAYTIRRTLNHPQGTAEIAAVCAAIGMDLCRPVFDCISPVQWARIQSTTEAAASPELLQRFFDRLFRDSLDWSPAMALQRSFALLRRKGGAWVAALFITQDVSQLALLSPLWVPEEMEMIQAALPAAARKEMTLGIFRLQRLPEEQVLLLSLKLLQRIHDIAAHAKPAAKPMSKPAASTPEQLHMQAELKAQSLALGDAKAQIERLARELVHARKHLELASQTAKPTRSTPLVRAVPPPFRHHDKLAQATSSADQAKPQIIPARRPLEPESSYSAVSAAIERINQRLPTRLSTLLPPQD